MEKVGTLHIKQALISRQADRKWVTVENQFKVDQNHELSDELLKIKRCLSRNDCSKAINYCRWKMTVDIVIFLYASSF